MTDHDALPPRGPLRSAFIPLFILLATYALSALFQTVQLARERSTLTAVRTNQDKLVQDSRRVRDNVDRLARDTQALADRGNQNAKLLVDELRRRGITINMQPSGTVSPPPSSGPPFPLAPSK